MNRRPSSNSRDPSLVKRGDARLAGVLRLLGGDAHNAVPGHLRAVQAHAWGGDRTLVMVAVRKHAARLQADEARALIDGCQEAMCV